MANITNLEQFLTDVATAIRTKKETTGQIPAANFDTEILSIDTIKGQEKTIIPSTAEQIITPDGDYNAITKATIKAVDNTIDSNISPENIKKDITVLGVTGTLEGVNNQDKEIITNGVYTADEGYTGLGTVTVNVPQENLQEQLNAQDLIIQQLQEELAGKASGGEITPNVFLQPNEPVIKEGIWIQAEGKTFDKIIPDNEVVTEPQFSHSNNLPYKFHDGSAVAIGNDIYLFGSGNSTDTKKTAYKYDTITNTFTRLTDIPFAFSNGSAVAIGNSIYLFYGTDAYRYDIETDTYTQLADNTYQIWDGIAVAVDNNTIYLLRYDVVHKYDIETNTYTKLGNISYDIGKAASVRVNDDIYFFGSSNTNQEKKVRKYNITTNTFTVLNDSPISFTSCSAEYFNGNIYLFRYTDVYKYDIETDTYIQLINIPYSFIQGSSVIVNDIIYLLGSINNPQNLGILQFPYKVYSDNSIVIHQGNGNYATQLFGNSMIEGRMLYPFYDVWHNTAQEGLNNTLPTYYGNGTEWVKFKN